METGKIKRYCKRKKRTILNLVNRTTVEQKSGYLINTDLHRLIIHKDKLTDKIMENYIMEGAYFFNRKGYYLHSVQDDEGYIEFNIAMYFLYKTKAVTQARMYKAPIIYNFETKLDEVVK